MPYGAAHARKSEIGRESKGIAPLAARFGDRRLFGRNPLPFPFCFQRFDLLWARRPERGDWETPQFPREARRKTRRRQREKWRLCEIGCQVAPLPFDPRGREEKQGNFAHSLRCNPALELKNLHFLDRALTSASCRNSCFCLCWPKSQAKSWTLSGSYFCIGSISLPLSLCRIFFLDVEWLLSAKSFSSVAAGRPPWPPPADSWVQLTMKSSPESLAYPCPATEVGSRG